MRNQKNFEMTETERKIRKITLKKTKKGSERTK